MSDISDMMYEQGYHDGYQLALSELNGKKFEKLIRCKDCKYAGDVMKKPKHPMFEKCWCNGKTKGWHSEDWYCADGERKDGDDDG